MTVSEVWLVRHGRTEWSATGRHTGRTDIPLDDVGVEAARSLAPALSTHRFTAVLSSPLSRALDTCRLAGLGDTAQTDDDLVEWDYGEDEGLTTPEIREHRDGWDLWRDGCRGGESAADVGARVDRVVARLLAFDGDVAVFAHGHLLRVLAARWLDLPPVDGALLVLGTATVSVLGWERERRVVQRWNLPPDAVSG